MDPEFFFEVKEPPTEITELDSPVRTSTEVSDEYRRLNTKMQLLLKTNPEVNYIYNKFKDPLDPVWFTGNYSSLKHIFISRDTINEGVHCYVVENFMKNKATINYTEAWVVEQVNNNNNKVPANMFITVTDGINFNNLNNPVIGKDYLIRESITAKPHIKLDYINCGPLPDAIALPEFYDKDVLFLANFHSLTQVLSKHLNLGGGAQFTYVSVRNIFEQDLYFLQILKLCFDKVILFRTKFAIGIGFRGIPSSLSKITKYVKTNKNTKDLKQFIISNIKKLVLNWVDKLANEDYPGYFKLLHRIYLDNKKLLNETIDAFDNDSTLFAVRTVKKNPEKINKYLSAGINEEEGLFLFKTVFDNKFTNLIEIGMANGISAAYMTAALKEQEKGKLISIDPFQQKQWKNNGLDTIAAMKTKTYHKLIEEKSFEALPRLLTKNKEKVDLVFVDGWHTFDYTLIDIFYGVLLLRIGGYLIIDDALHPGVANTLKYLDTNYTMLKRKTSPRSFGVYQKIQDDTRDWDFHKKF